jgi:hypothetical protein
MAEHRDTDPPQPPPFQRKIIVARVQAIGVSVLAAIVVAALLGLLGLRPGETQAASGGLEVMVSYPKILRYRTSLPLEVSVKNTGHAALSRVDVRFDRAYIEAFQDVRLTPDPGDVSDRHYTVRLANVPPGESRKVVAWLEAHARGPQRARLQVAAESQPALDLDWTTTVLP